MVFYMPLPPDKKLDSSLVEKQIKLWIEKCVLQWDLCPFARAPFQKKQVHIHVYLGQDPQEFLEDLLSHAHQLLHWSQNQNRGHTTLIATPNHWLDFESYWDCVGWLEDCLIHLGLEGLIQIASFHPQYQFEGEEGVGVYSNRSPYPLFHLLLEEEMEEQIAGFSGVEDLGERNRKHLESLGLDAVLHQLKKCGWRP